MAPKAVPNKRACEKDLSKLDDLKVDEELTHCGETIKCKQETYENDLQPGSNNKEAHSVHPVGYTIWRSKHMRPSSRSAATTACNRW